MSDVEARIEQWRAGLAGSEVVTASDVTELESHLREEMGRLKASGLSDNEAFFVARSRLGDITALESEFAKVNASQGMKNRLCWMIAGLLAYWVAVHFAGVVSGISLAIVQAMGGRPHIVGLIAGGMRIAAFCGGVALILWLCAHNFRLGSPSRVQITKRVRIAFLVGLLIETVGFTITKMCGIVYVARSLPIQDYVRAVQAESYGDFAWRLVGPLLLGVLLVVIHMAGRREIELQ
jgi:hypothetical protein